MSLKAAIQSEWDIIETMCKWGDDCWHSKRIKYRHGIGYSCFLKGKSRRQHKIETAAKNRIRKRISKISPESRFEPILFLQNYHDRFLKYY